MARRNVCKVEGCETRIAATSVLCPEHFRRVPLALRRQLNAAYRRFARRQTQARRRRALTLRRRVLASVA